MSQASGSLRCILTRSSSDWLRLGPMKIEIHSQNPYHSVIKELLYPHECDKLKVPLVRLLDGRRKGHPQHQPSLEWTDIRVMKK